MFLECFDDVFGEILTSKTKDLDIVMYNSGNYMSIFVLLPGLLYYDWDQFLVGVVLPPPSFRRQSRRLLWIQLYFV